ncbi:hypothetical protein Sango_0652900 [Sesamum angolense]|uniref:Uncharacterized protein n=1 Tax=Sesamum angolense TaxID=2727404 RepID=A0AAE1X6Z5_9LAMI|nr:hypothetical protein Sango_0652900 [Sesamum angolense]
MYNKNLPGRAGLTLKFEDGVKTFIKWAKSQCRLMDGDKNWVPLPKVQKHKGEGIVQEYIEARSVPQVSKESTTTGHVEGNYPQWVDEQHIDWAQRMVFDAVGPNYFASSHEGVPNDGTRSCPVDASLSSYCYGGGPYDYDESGLVDGDIYERIYNRISQWANRILPSDHTLPRDYYITKKLVKDLGLLVEKINACKNGCMLYWKDDVDLEYCKFCGDTRNKPSRGRDLHQKKSPHDVLRYLPITPHLQRLYSSRATAEHMTWHATHQTEEGSMYNPSDAEAWKHFDQMYPDFAEELRNVRLGLYAVGFGPHEELLQLWHVGVRMYDHAQSGFHHADDVDVDCE